MYSLFITHSPMEICYLVAKDQEGKLAYMLSITPTAYFDLRERAIPEIPFQVAKSITA